MSGEATRYTDETPNYVTRPDVPVVNAAPARKEANKTSDVVVTLQPGNKVTLVAERHEFTLVTWKNKSGDHYGWVETALAFKTDHPGVHSPGDLEGLGRVDPGGKTTPTPVPTPTTPTAPPTTRPPVAPAMRPPTGPMRPH